jgi:hypothetical protein
VQSIMIGHVSQWGASLPGLGVIIAKLCNSAPEDTGTRQGEKAKNGEVDSTSSQVGLVFCMNADLYF